MNKVRTATALSFGVSLFLASAVYAEPNNTNLPMFADSWNLAPPSSSSSSSGGSDSVLSGDKKVSTKQKEKILADIEKHNRKLSKLDDKIRTLNDKVTNLMVEKSNLEKELVDGVYESVILKREIALSEKNYQKSLEVTEDFIVTQQRDEKSTGIMVVESLVTSNSFSDLLHKATVLGVLIKSKSDILEDLKDNERSILDKKYRLDTHMETLRDSRNLLSQKEKQLHALKKSVMAEIERVQNAKGVAERGLFSETDWSLAGSDLSKYNLTKPQLLTLSKRLDAYYASPDRQDEGKAQRVILEAYKYLGVPYVWGGTKTTGFDCSGLMGYIFREVGVDLPRVARDQQNVGNRISPYEVKAGDMVFYRDPATHVGIYIGGGKYLHSPKPGDVVRIQDYVPSDWTSAVSVLDNGGGQVPADLLKRWVSDIKEQSRKDKKIASSPQKQKKGN